MILMIDNYDSFTYNLVQYLGELGQELKVYRNDKIDIEKIESLKPSSIVISPGPGTPKQAGVTIDIIKEFSGSIPMLGVCLGHQAIVEAFEGRIEKAPEPVHGKTSEIFHDNKTIFEGIKNPFIATRYHSLIAKKDSLPDDLEVSAWTNEEIIMGVRHKEKFFEGIQFHPESILTVEGKKILRNFLQQKEAV
ncbi:MAG: aminodeoxychorismate/anthranilate synthase component II [Actinobacteria bacterium]|nr:MAG: aminodeoxychorismate/anthranilate synthase component II [Actinomycetota bacterium]